MSQFDTFNRILASLHEAMLDDAHWPATSALVDEFLGTVGNAILVGEGPEDDVRILFAALHYRGQRRPDLERDYLDNYHPWDECVPRVRKLPDGKLVHVTDLLTEPELKTSRAYNEYSPRSNTQNSLVVRLDGPDGSHISWIICDPVQPGDWSSARTERVACLLPHIRQFVQVRQALANAGVLGEPLAGLLDNTRLGVIQLGRRGRIIEANDRARDILRRGDGLFDQGGFLRARLPSDNARLEGLLAQVLPRYGEAASSGSLTVRRPPGLPRLVVHLSPVAARQMDFGLKSVAALVLVVDPASRPRIDPVLVAAALDLTPSQSQVAVMLTQGRSVHDIAATTGRQPSTVRQFLKQIYNRRNLTGRADLVRLVLSLSDLPGLGP